MAFKNKNQALGTGFEPGSELEGEDLEKLELDVKEMAQRIAEYRTTLPDQLMTTLASVLSSQRPLLPSTESGLEPGLSWEANPDSGQTEPSQGASLANEDQQESEKMNQLKERMSRNISAIPIIVKRMQECISRIEKLDSLNGTIHPAFRKKRTS